MRIKALFTVSDGFWSLISNRNWKICAALKWVFSKEQEIPGSESQQQAPSFSVRLLLILASFHHDKPTQLVQYTALYSPKTSNKQNFFLLFLSSSYSVLCCPMRMPKVNMYAENSINFALQQHVDCKNVLNWNK